MSGTIYLFRHIPDRRRGETLNVGVALHARGELEALFAGEREPGEVDGRTTRHLVSDAGAYADWVHYWRHVLDRGQEGLAELIAPLSQRPDFMVERVGEIVLDDAEDPLFTLAHLYAQLVDRKGADADAVNAQRVASAANKLLEQAGVVNKVGFKRRIPVRDPLKPSVLHTFPFGVRNGRLTVGAAVGLDSNRGLEQYCFRFQHAPPQARRVCLVRHSEVDDPRSVYLSDVTDIIVDVDNEDAIEQVREAFA